MRASNIVAVMKANAATKSTLSHRMRPCNWPCCSCSKNSDKNITRVYYDCKTSTTPLWRSGPMGPKVIN